MALKYGYGLIFAVCIFALPGCNDGQVSGTSAATENAPDNEVPLTLPPNLNSCQEKIVDYGQKGTVSAVSRGAASDVKIIPGTSSPSVAFADAGTLSLRFSFFNGTRYITEIIAGEGSASFVKLDYLSSGRPVVFWATGSTTLKAAFRSSPPGQSGTWTAAVIDSSTASRAISVKVNSLDEIAVLQITNTANTGRARFLYCPAGCASPTGFQTMSTGVQIESANIVPAQQVTDVAWCRVSQSDYYPAVVYGGNSVTRYAICRQSDLAQCLSEANWIKQNVVAGANVSASLHLDESLDGDIPKVALLKAGAGIKTYSMGSTSCAATPGAFTELTSTIGGSTSGSAWLKLLKDQSGQFHIIANEGTTSVRYYNNTNTNILSGTWAAAGVIDTITLTAGQTGGADYSPLDNRIYTSYPQAARGFNLMLASLQNINVASSSLQASLQSIDTSGALQLVSAPQKNLRLRLDSENRPGAAYVDFSPGAATGARLKYARRLTASPGSSWEISLVPNTTNPQFPDLAYDQQNHPWISYFDQTTNRFFLVTNSEADGSGIWSHYQFPIFPTGTYTFPATNSTAVVMDQSQVPWQPVMIILDSTNTTQGVKAARLNPENGLWSNPELLDPMGVSDGTSLSADANADGEIAVAFQDLTLGRLRYVASGDGGRSWGTVQSISAPNQGAGATIRLNPSTGSPLASFYDRANNKVAVSECSGDALACASQSWNSTEIDAMVGTSGLTNSATVPQDQLLSAAVSFYNDGTPYVSYTRTGAAGGQLLTAQFATADIKIYTLKTAINAGLIGTTPYNHGVGGWNISTAIGSTGNFESLFIGPGNWLYSKSCGN